MAAFFMVWLTARHKGITGSEVMAAAAARRSSAAAVTSKSCSFWAISQSSRPSFPKDRKRNRSGGTRNASLSSFLPSFDLFCRYRFFHKRLPALGCGSL